MADEDSGLFGPVSVPGPLARWAERFMTASFVILLAVTVLPLLVSLVRGPDRILIPYPQLAAGYFAKAGISLHLFKLLRLWTGCLTGLNLAGAAVLVFRQYRKRRRQPVAAILAFGFLMLSLGMNGLLLLGNVQLLGLAYAMFALGLSFFSLALMIFPDGRFVPSPMRWVALILVLLTPLGIAGVLPLSVWDQEKATGPAGLIFLLLAVVALLLRYARLPAGSERQQVRWALFGFAAGALLIIPFVAIDNLLQHANVQPIVWVAGISGEILLLIPLMNVLITGGLVVSLLKYRLYDADRVISRSVSFGALTLTLLALFTGTERVIELLGEKWFGEEIGVFAGGIGAAIAVAMFVPLHHRLTHWAEHKFQKQLIRLRIGLPLLVGDMRETAPVARIAAATLEGVSHGVRASRAALVFEGVLLDARGIETRDVERWLQGWSPAMHPDFDIDRADPLFPLRVPLAADGHGRIGWLLLGPRPDGSFYGKDERETLAQIADPVARALEIAAAREQREGEERAAWQEQRTINRALLGTLQALDGRLERLFPPPAEAAE